MSADDLLTTKIERLRVKPESGPAFTVLVDIEWESQGVLYGHEVDAEGTLMGTMLSDGTTSTRRDHLISTALIVRRTPMVMNRHYGKLEPAP